MPLTTPPAAPSPALPDPGQQRKALDRSLVSGIAWTGGMRGVTQALQWLAALLVVRLLTPADYGLVGMATAYLGLVRMLSEFGLGAAVIQRRHLTSRQIAEISGVSLFFSLTFALTSIAVSGLIASFYREPQVQTIIIVLSMTFVFSGLDMIPRSLMKRDLHFKHFAWVQASENVSYAITSLTLASLGYGYWSLVFGAVAGSAVRMTVALATRGHAIAWPRAFSGIRDELVFGWHVVGARLAIYVRQFADVVIVGRILGRVPLGAYTVAWNQSNIAVDRVSALMNEVAPSVLSAAQHDKAELRRYLRVMTEGIAFLSFPATLGMAVVADDFVLLLFGEPWAATIAPLRILAVTGALRSITPILSQVLIALGETRRNMNFTVTSAIVIPILLVIGTRWGLTGVATAWLIGHPLVMVPTLQRRTLEILEMPLTDYLRCLMPAALSSIATVGAVLAVRAVMPDSLELWQRFTIEVSSGAIVYGIAVAALYRRRLRSFLTMMKAARRRAAPTPPLPKDVSSADG